MTVKTQTLRQRVVKASGWTLFHFGGSQTIRLLGNLVLTRLLAPEMFGVMAIVLTLMTAISMLTDLGIRASIIQDKRGSDQAFLNTAWSIQIIRGCVIWIILIFVSLLLNFLAGAGIFDVSSAYASPTLPWLIVFVGLSALIQGFDSVALHLASKRLHVQKIVLIELLSQIIAVSVMIFVAYSYGTIWALAIGAIVGPILKMLASHHFFSETRVRFEIDCDLAMDIYQYGKWIMVNSITNFISKQGDKLLLGIFLPANVLGVYIIAAMLAEAPALILTSINQNVLFPMFSERKNDGYRELRNTYHRIHLRIAIFLPLMIGFLIAVSQELIDFLYDMRYEDAGWMLQILLFKAFLSISIGPGSALLLAIGDSKLPAIATTARAILLFIAVVSAAAWFDEKAMVLAVSLSALASWPVIMVALLRRGYYAIWPDIFILGTGATGYFAGWLLLLLV